MAVAKTPSEAVDKTPLEAVNKTPLEAVNKKHFGSSEQDSIRHLVLMDIEGVRGHEEVFTRSGLWLGLGLG